MTDVEQNETNTVHVLLPPDAGLRSATEVLKRFGDVSHVEVLPGQALTVSAVYFDVRAAARAQSAMGELCRPAAPTGDRTVRLQGSIQLDPEKIQGVSRVLPEPDESGAFLVEFFDLRDAARAREWCAGQSSGKPGAPAACDSKKASVPAYIKPSNSVAPAPASTLQQVSAPRVQAREPARTSRPSGAEAMVLLKGLPKALCTNACLEAMFEQAGFEGTIASCRVRRGNMCSEVLVSFDSKDAARRCIQHFHGRCWSNSGERVTASKVSSKGDSLHRPLRAPQKAPLPEDIEEADEEDEESSSTAPEGPPGLCAPRRLPEVSASGKLDASRKEDLATDESTADGASLASDQEEAV